MSDRTYRERIFFAAGDIVQVKHDLEDKPKMLVQSVDKAAYPADSKTSMLLGVTCIWFSTDLKLQKNRFNTKDLEKV